MRPKQGAAERPLIQWNVGAMAMLTAILAAIVNLPPVGYEHLGVTAHFTTARLLTAKRAFAGSIEGPLIGVQVEWGERL